MLRLMELRTQSKSWKQLHVKNDNVSSISFVKLESSVILFSIARRLYYDNIIFCRMLYFVMVGTESLMRSSILYFLHSSLKQGNPWYTSRFLPNLENNLSHLKQCPYPTRKNREFIFTGIPSSSFFYEYSLSPSRAGVEAWGIILRVARERTLLQREDITKVDNTNSGLLLFIIRPSSHYAWAWKTSLFL